MKHIYCMLIVSLLRLLACEGRPDSSLRVLSITTPVAERRCFATSLELRQAVDAYLYDDSSDTDVAATYGWPIGTWCVDAVENFDGLFSRLRNRRSATFNEDISEWNVARATSMKYMFLLARDFDQDLCAWGDLLDVSTTSFNLMFRGTSCTTKVAPYVDVVPTGPFCEYCFSQGTTSAPSRPTPSEVFPSVAPTTDQSREPPSTDPTPEPTPETSVSRVAEVILPVALFDGNEFIDPNSYQSKALAWLEDSNTDGMSDQTIIQRYSLACIYCATYNVSTVFTDDALGGAIVPWTRDRYWLSDSNECGWANIDCDAANNVVTLDLFGNFVSGEFPPEVVYLEATLQVLDLGNNFVFTRGEVFNSYLGRLTELVDLRYDNTNFINEEGIPTEIGNMKNLRHYNCANVRYVGALNGAAFPSDMTQLTYLDIEFNSYNSTIPLELGNLPALRFLYARKSSLEGDLEFMRNMPAIEECWIDSNPGIGGVLPTFLGSLSTLASFAVTQSGWTGALPTELGLLSNVMLQMYLSENAFTSTIPTEWGNLNVIQQLQMEFNMLDGLIPPFLCFKRFTSLTSLKADCVNCPMASICCTLCYDEFGNPVTDLP